MNKIIITKYKNMNESLVPEQRESWYDQFSRWHFQNSLPPLESNDQYSNTVFCNWLNCCAFCYKMDCKKNECLCEKDSELMCCCFTIIFK
jgi:hypothetical protein